MDYMDYMLQDIPPQPGGPQGVGGYIYGSIYIYIYIFWLVGCLLTGWLGLTVFLSTEGQNARHFLRIIFINLRLNVLALI